MKRIRIILVVLLVAAAALIYVVGSVPARAHASPTVVTAPPVDRTFPWPDLQPRHYPLEYRACSNQCNAVRDQCIAACGPGPDHVNNPNWLSCRKNCRAQASECRHSCPEKDVASGSPDDSEQ